MTRWAKVERKRDYFCDGCAERRPVVFRLHLDVDARLDACDECLKTLDRLAAQIIREDLDSAETT